MPPGGSDFSYYDMGDSGRGIAGDYEARLEDKNASFEGSRCYKIALIPKAGKDVPYEKLTAYISQEDYRRLQDRDYPFRYVMESHVKPTSTEVVTISLEFDSPRVEAGLFTVPYLEQIR